MKERANRKGIIYGVGVGPGDPELMTLKAVRLIRETDVIAVPGTEPVQSVAYRIAVQAVPELAEKEVIAVNMPMIRDREKIGEEHKKAARVLEDYPDRGQDVVCLTLGDPTVYSSFSYLQHILEADGYTVCLVSGVSSIQAAAARLNFPLTEWDEPLHVYPAVHGVGSVPEPDGTVVLMKTGSRLKEMKERFAEEGYGLKMAENCGMENERVYQNAEEMPDQAGYFSILLAAKRS